MEKATLNFVNLTDCLQQFFSLLQSVIDWSSYWSLDAAFYCVIVLDIYLFKPCELNV